MNKAVISGAILAALASGSVFAANVYKDDTTKLDIGGRVEFRGDFIGDDGAEIEGTMVDNSRARINLKGEQKIDDNLSVFGFYEAEHKTGSSEFSNRYIYAGVATQAGKFSVGRQNTAAVQVSDMTDITEFSGGQQVITASKDKRDSVFAYQGELNDLSMQATYIANEDEDTDGYGISGIYSLPFGLDLGAAYSMNNNGVGLGQANQALFGAGYTLDNLYVAATYSFGDIDDKTDTDFTQLELALQYKITSQLRTTALYSKGEENDEDVNDFIELGARYDLTKKFRTYAAYVINNLDSADKDTLRLGVRYDF